MRQCTLQKEHQLPSQDRCCVREILVKTFVQSSSELYPKNEKKSNLSTEIICSSHQSGLEAA
jgi:hypothetical protein